MCIELSLDDTINSCNFEDQYDFSHHVVRNSTEDFHKSIYVPPEKLHQLFFRTSCLDVLLPGLESKTREVARACKISPLGNFNGEVGGKISWGGEEGVQASGYASGSASDSKGNTVNVAVEVSSDGSGSASASAGRKEDSEGHKKNTDSEK